MVSIWRATAISAMLRPRRWRSARASRAPVGAGPTHAPRARVSTDRLDVHRKFAQVAIRETRRFAMPGRPRSAVRACAAFAESLGPEDEVAIEATCNTHSIVRTIERRFARVIVSTYKHTGDHSDEGRRRRCVRRS